MTEPIVAQFVESVNSVVDRFRDEGITVAEVLGALVLIQHQVIKDAIENAENT